MKYATSASIALVAATLAIYCGYTHYKAAPIGDLFYTPIDRCPTYSHSFTTGYILTLIVEIVLWVFVAGGSWIIARLAGKPKAPFRSVLSMRSTFFGVAILVVAAFVHPIFESLLPLQPDPRCAQHGP